MADDQHLQGTVSVTADADSVAWANTVITDVGHDLLRYLARRADQQDVPDLLNDTLRVLWERRTDLPNALGEARMWAFGVARNTLRKHRHSYTKRARIAAALRSVVLFVGDADRLSIDPADAAEGSESMPTCEQPSGCFGRAIANWSPSCTGTD